MAIRHLWQFVPRQPCACTDSLEQHRSKPPPPNSQSHGLQSDYGEILMQDRYCVRPNSGIIEPNESVEVQGMNCLSHHGEMLAYGHSSPASDERGASLGRQMPRQIPRSIRSHVARSRSQRHDPLANRREDREEHHTGEEDSSQLPTTGRCRNTQWCVLSR